jgi:hypothetical protein
MRSNPGRLAGIFVTATSWPKNFQALDFKDLILSISVRFAAYGANFGKAAAPLRRRLGNNW